METIDREYQVVQTLGAGLAGEVFLVKKGAKKYALKLLKTQIANLSAEEALAHFKAECSILKQLTHPHIAKLLDFGKDSASGRYYYTAEYIEGKDLFTATRGKKPEAVEELFLQALRALAYLQAHGIAHYDLKPENLLVETASSQLKLIDFGMAGFRPRAQLAGTPAYLAPEIVLGNKPDARADLYSLGVAFYECVTGSNPFHTKSLQETLRLQETLDPPPSHLANSQVSRPFSDVLTQLMNKNPAQRPAGASLALRTFAQLSGKKILMETLATSLSYMPNETRLIGRERELQAFRTALKPLQEVAATPTPSTLLITGEAGLGKSRLLREMRFHAQLAGTRTIVLEKAELPELAENSILFLDDSSYRNIKNLAVSLSHASLSILLVAATDETPPVQSQKDFQILPLKPFSKQEIAAYLTALTGLAEPPAKLVQELEKRSGGSPQLLTDILGELVRRGTLVDERGRWSAETLEDLGVDFGTTQTPELLEKRFERDFEKLDGPARKILQSLSVVKEPVSAELLLSVNPDEDLFYWILELLNQGYLRRDDGSQAYSIANPYFQSYLEKNLPASDKEKIHEAWYRAWQDHPAGAERALHHQGRSGSNIQAQQALADLAEFQEKRGQIVEALENLSLAERIPSTDFKTETVIKIRKGIMLTLLNRLGEAEEVFDFLQKKLEKTKNDPQTLPLKISTLEKLGAAYLRGGLLEKARGTFEAGLQLMEGREKNFLKKSVLFRNYLGRIFFLKGDREGARKIFEATRKDWKENLSEIEQKAIINNELGEVLLSLGNYAKAKQQLRSDLEFFHSIPDEVQQGKALYHLALAESGLKNFDEALRIYRQCAELVKSQNNLPMLLRVYNGMGGILEIQHQYEESRRQFERALAIAQKIADLPGQAGLQVNLGIVLNAMGQGNRAIPHLTAALTLLQSFENPGAHEQMLVARGKLELGEAYQKTREWEPAEKFLQEAQAMAEKHPHLSTLVFPVRAAQVRLHWNLNRVEEAKKIFGKLEQEARDEKEKTELAKLRNLLSREPEAYRREAAVTLGATETPMAGETSQYFSVLGQGEFARLLELSRIINTERNLDFVLKNVLQYAIDLSGAERGLILLLDDQERLEIRASLNTSLNPNLSEISTRVAEQVLSTGDLVEADDAASDARFHEYQSVMLLKLRSILCLPIHSRNKTVGVLYLDNRYRPGAFRKNRQALLQAFCDQAGIAIENASLFDRYERAQAQLQKRLERVEEEVDHYHELLGEETRRLPTKYAYDHIVARSKPMYEVFKLLDKITETNISVFINGETGTGKELIAKALHYNNRQRAEKRFVAINCGGIPPNLIESELFGYKAGAFTGASKDKKGLFAEADGGTLFMDEVAELDLGLQVKLLRALEEGEVIPIGETRPVRFDARVISASHKNLEELIGEGKFREDLYYRICQIKIPLPPLRERREDIPLLAEKFAANFAKEHGQKKVPKLSGNLLKKLLEYDWPGNVRELENTIRVAGALSEGKEITVKDLPANFGARSLRPSPLSSRRDPFGAHPSPLAPRSSLLASQSSEITAIDPHNHYDPRLSWADYEKRIFAKAYAAHDFKPIPTAEALDVSIATFYKRVKDYDLNDHSNPLYADPFVISRKKILREYLEDITWAAYQASGEKAYTAIKWLDVSQGHFYSVLKAAKRKKGAQ